MSPVISLKEHAKITCFDCGGWPINDGAVFVGVVMIKDDERRNGHMCEGCYLKRMARRGRYVNMSSSRVWQIELPELNLLKDRDAKEEAEWTARGAKYMDALCALSVALGLPLATEEMRDIGVRFIEEYKRSHPTV